MADIYIYDSYDKKSISEGVSVWKTDYFVHSTKNVLLSCQLQIKEFSYYKCQKDELNSIHTSFLFCSRVKRWI